LASWDGRLKGEARGSWPFPASPRFDYSRVIRRVISFSTVLSGPFFIAITIRSISSKVYHFIVPPFR